LVIGAANCPALPLAIKAKTDGRCVFRVTPFLLQLTNSLPQGI
jgi:hypothetical protein